MTRLLSICVALCLLLPSFQAADYLRRSDIVDRFLKSDKVRSCELPVVDVPPKLTEQEFEQLLVNHGRAVLLRGLRRTWLNPNEWNRTRFLSKFGDYQVLVTDGRNDIATADTFRETMTIHDFMATAGKAQHNFVAKAYDHQITKDLFWGTDGNCSEDTLLTWLCKKGAKGKSPTFPTFLKDFDNRVTIQFGASMGSGTQLHGHQETWFTLLEGMKAWWIAPDKPYAGSDFRAELGKHPCEWLEQPAPTGLSFCVLHPGDVLYFSNSQNHATCNLGDFVLGVGSQGRLSKDTTPAEKAAHRGQVGWIDRYLKSKKNLNWAELQTLLGCASFTGHKSVISTLMEHRADIALPAGNKDKRGMRALHLSAYLGHAELTSFLLDIGADAQVEDDMNLTAFHYATMAGSPEVAKVILDKAHIDASQFLDSPRRPGALFHAGRSGERKLMEVLLNSTQLPDPKSNLFDIAVQAATYGDVAMLRLLANRDFIDLKKRDRQQLRVIDHAKRNDRKEAVRLLKKYAKGLKPNEKAHQEL